MMSGKSSNSLAYLLRSILLLSAMALVMYGVWYLETKGKQDLVGYIPLLAGALIIGAVPKSEERRDSCGILSSSITSLLLLAASLSCATLLYAPTLQLLNRSGQAQVVVPKLVLLWSGAVVFFLLFCGSLDLRRKISIPRPSKGEMVIIGAIFFLSLLIRCWGPISWVGDEISQVIEITSYYPHTASPIGASATTYPYFLLYLFYLLHRATSQFVDLMPLLKFSSYVVSSFSIVCIYCIARLVSSQRIAIYTAMLLVMWGWHWVNSRFVYAYPIDMASITFGLLMFILAVRFSSLTCAALAGISCALALITRKVGLMICPLLVILSLEALITAKSGSGRLRLLVALMIIGCSAVIAYGPELVVQIVAGGQFSRQQEAAELRAALFPKMGLNVYSATALMTWDGFRQLQTAICDRARHIFRPDAPILDPVFSGFFSIGLVYSLTRIRSFQAGRLAILGMLIFSLPLALSFPVESSVCGLARRMICASFFIAFLAGIGVDVAATRLVSLRHAHVFGLSMCAASMLANVYYALTIYSHPGPRQYHDMSDRALVSTAMMTLAREAGTNGIPTVIFEQFNADTQGAASNFSEVKRVLSLAEFRETLLSRRGRLQLAILPWDTQLQQRTSQETVEQLADVIPPYLWIPGDRDPQGVPMLRYAYVRIP